MRGFPEYLYTVLTQDYEVHVFTSSQKAAEFVCSFCPRLELREYDDGPVIKGPVNERDIVLHLRTNNEAYLFRYDERVSFAYWSYVIKKHDKSSVK